MARISDFKAMLRNGGARPNQFRVELHFPQFVQLGVVAGAEAQFLCKAASLPAVTLENIQVHYRGRPVNFAGERTYQPWGITVYNDTTFNIRNQLEVWSNGIQHFEDTEGIVNPRDYQVDLRVHQLGRNGETLKTYKFVDAYPVAIGQIQLDYESNNAIEMFDVEFQYNYYTSNTSSGGDGFGVNGSVDTPIGTVELPI